MKTYRFYVDFDFTEVAHIEAENEEQARDIVQKMDTSDFIEMFKLPLIGLSLANTEMFSEDYEDYSINPIDEE